MSIITVILIIVSIFLSIKWMHYRKRCRECGKWNSLIQVDNNFLRNGRRKKIFKTTHKDSRGRVSGTSEREGVEIYPIYLVTFQCKYCETRHREEFAEGRSILQEGITFFVVCLLIIAAIYKTQKDKEPVKTENSQSQISVDRFNE